MPATLFTYMRQVQRFLHDSNQELIDPGDIIEYVNQSRREVAMRGQCIRLLPVISGSIVSVPIPVVSGWTGPVTVAISPPDSPSGALPFPQGAQATATATLAAGVIDDVEVTYGGYGYFQPQAVFTDAVGHTATVFAVTTNNNLLNQGQEIYRFGDVDLSQFPGVQSIYMVRGVSVLYSNYRYSLPFYSFTTYQAMIRQYIASQYQYVPTFGAQLGRGTGGSLYLYPPPSQAYQMEWDCCCLPSDLNVDQDVEALPDPWTDAVPYFAAHLAFLELQNLNTARMYNDLFDERVKRFGGYVQPGRVSNPYGRF